MLTSSSVDKKKPLRMPWCVSGLVCRLCRDLEGGRAWREQTAELFNVMEVDWPCPKGHEWGYQPPAREPKAPKPEPAFVVARRAACLACDEEACFLKRMLTTKPCAFRSRIVRPGMVCPKGRWPSEVKEKL